LIDHGGEAACQVGIGDVEIRYDKQAAGTSSIVEGTYSTGEAGGACKWRNIRFNLLIN